MDEGHLELLNQYEIKKNIDSKIRGECFCRYKDLILNTFGDIVFIEETHKYFLGSSELTPVTNLIHKFKEDVDWDTIKKNYARKNGVDVKTVDKWWSLKNIIATNSGTHVHEFAESCFYYYTGEFDKVLPMFKRQIERGYLLPNSMKELAAAKFWNDIIKTPGIIPLLSETQVHSKFIEGIFPYAGTFDLLLYYRNPKTGSEGVMICDYKTNESLENDYNRSHNKCLLYPFNDMIEEAMSEYTLQLSAYQLPLKKTLGLPVLGRRLVHLKDDGTYSIIKLNDETDRLYFALKNIK